MAGLGGGLQDQRWSMSDPLAVHIFLSSPSDVGPEREIAERVISRLDGIWNAHVRLRVKRWEKAHYQAIKGFQEAIGEMAAYDVVIGIFGNASVAGCRQICFAAPMVRRTKAVRCSRLKARLPPAKRSKNRRSTFCARPKR
jgi:hypothetical protein